jgi:prepilin-type N-terminal cleavage/methylation domain-containing protein
MLSRSKGVTLVELLVALALAAVVLGTATTSALRQQRSHATIISTVGADAQIRAATQVLAGQLALLDPLADDLAPGEAEDTVVQIRAPVAASLACQREIGAATFLPDDTSSVSLGGAVSSPRAGDTLWWRGDTTWNAREISGVGGTTASCSSPVVASGVALRVVLGGQDTIDAGSPVRVTRQTRYGLYRASDGTWQLGVREWNDSTHHFPAPQPMAGPLLLRSGGRSTGFRYFDAAGTELSSPIAVRSVARIRITALSVAMARDRLLDSIRVDSVDVAMRHVPGP